MEHHLSRSTRLVVALALNVVLASVQFASGLIAHSTGLLADAGHNVADFSGLGVALMAVRWARLPRSSARSFGNHRATILAALINATVIAAVTAAIAFGAIERLVHPHPVHGTVVLVVAGAALLLNSVMALSLHEHHDLNMRASAWHMAGDAMASLAVVVAGVVLVVQPSLEWADPAASLAVAALIVAQAVRLLRGSVEVLLESSPADVDMENLQSAMVAVGGVSEVHDLHVWSLSSEIRAMSAHVVLSGHPTLEQAQVVGEHVKAAVAGPFTIAHCTLELECERCVDEEDDPCLMDATAPASTRRPR